MTDTQALESTRKSPRQERARHTIATLLETTARILAEEGGERLTTNHLARKSGYSIGTIYQYFTNREALVLALIERQRADTRARVAAVANDPHGGGAEQRIRRIVRTLHDAFYVHHKPARRLTAALLQLALARGLPAPSDDIAQAIVTVWRDAEGADLRLNDAEVFVLTRAIVEVLRHATLHGSPLMGSAQFEDAILRLILGFVRAAPPR